MNNNSLAQSSNFEFGCPTFDFGPQRLTQTAIPGLNVGYFETGSRRGAVVHVQGDTVTYNDLPVTMLVDENFETFLEFYDKFMKDFNPEDGTFNLDDFECYIQINDNQGYPLFKVEYHNCKLVSYDDITLDTQTDQEFITFTVNIKYDYYTIVRSPQPETFYE